MIRTSDAAECNLDYGNYRGRELNDQFVFGDWIHLDFKYLPAVHLFIVNYNGEQKENLKIPLAGKSEIETSKLKMEVAAEMGFNKN